MQGKAKTVVLYFFVVRKGVGYSISDIMSDSKKNQILRFSHHCCGQRGLLFGRVVSHDPPPPSLLHWWEGDVSSSNARNTPPPRRLVVLEAIYGRLWPSTLAWPTTSPVSPPPPAACIVHEWGTGPAYCCGTCCFILFGGRMRPSSKYSWVTTRSAPSPLLAQEGDMLFISGGWFVMDPPPSQAYKLGISIFLWRRN